MNEKVTEFLRQVSAADSRGNLVKITLGNKRIKSGDLNNVFVKPVALKHGANLSFVYRHTTSDITKNLPLEDGINELTSLLETSFFNADCFTGSGDFHLLQQSNGKGKLVTRPATLRVNPASRQHDKQKNRLIKAGSSNYLQALGITTPDGTVKKDMFDKYRQINRYVEIVQGIIKDVSFTNKINVVDMGSGKGYLTFALYDFLTSTLQLDAAVTGIELRPDLVKLCNQIAKDAKFEKLQFKEGSIAGTSLEKTDLLIALHACDTATDDAIFKGIESGAAVIICAPCCHKQIRKEMRPDNILHQITKHGILLERQAEMVTDSIRALLMEANGYKTKVFDFIATEHTPKNVMIAGTKSPVTQEKKVDLLQQVADLKAIFNIKTHYLERLLNGDTTSPAIG